MKNINYLERCFKHTVAAENLIYELQSHYSITEIDDKVYNLIDDLLKITLLYAEKVGQEIEKAPF